jgi:Tol biopolymer transport system component
MAGFVTHVSLSLLLVFPVFSLRAQAASATTPSFPSNEQLRQFKTMNDPRLAPDGKRILIRVTDATADGGKSHLWLTGVSGEDPRQLTYSPEADKRGEYDGEWMPDGQSILFLAKRDAYVSLYRLPMTGGEAKAFSLKITPVVDQARLPDALPLKTEEGNPESQAKPAEVEIDVTRYQVAPDGNTIAILAQDPETPGEKAQKEAKADADWVNHNPHGARLYLLTVATGKLLRLPVSPDVHHAYWSSDSSKLLAISEGPNGAADLAPAMSSWLVGLADQSHPEPLADLPPTIEVAGWTPGRNSIIYLAQARHDAPPGYADLYSYDLDTRTTHDLSDGWKGSVRNEALPCS